MRVSKISEESIADIDIYVSYLIEDYEAAMEISYTAIELSVEVQDEGTSAISKFSISKVVVVNSLIIGSISASNKFNLTLTS